MVRKALFLGIDQYAPPIPGLKGCVQDAIELETLLSNNHDTQNFQALPVDLAAGLRTTQLYESINRLFEQPKNADILFYFSGHGASVAEGSFLVSSDGQKCNWGYPMNGLFTRAQTARHNGAKSVTLILDCCHSGAAGDDLGGTQLVTSVQIPDGVTLLAASRPSQNAMIVNGRSAFTALLKDALNGGAANPLGRVSAAAAYAYIEAAFGAFDQRPVYKSNAEDSLELRCCRPVVTRDDLHALTRLFVTKQSELQLDPDFEGWRLRNPPGKGDERDDVDPYDGCPAKRQDRERLKRLQLAGLLECPSSKNLFWACVYSKPVTLSILGQYYWNQVKASRI